MLAALQWIEGYNGLDYVGIIGRFCTSLDHKLIATNRTNYLPYLKIGK